MTDTSNVAELHSVTQSGLDHKNQHCNGFEHQRHCGIHNEVEKELVVCKTSESARSCRKTAERRERWVHKVCSAAHLCTVEAMDSGGPFARRNWSISCSDGSDEASSTGVR